MGPAVFHHLLREINSVISPGPIIHVSTRHFHAGIEVSIKARWIVADNVNSNNIRIFQE